MHPGAPAEGGGVSTEIRRVLWPRGSRSDIWAIVDCARDRSIYWPLVNSYLPFSCLFAGALPEIVEAVAPHLVRVDPDDAFARRLFDGWGNSLCVYLEYDGSIEELRHHLRTILTVEDAAGNRVLFRYYDPRVLRAYLPTCHAEELRTVFGPVKAFWMEARDPATLLEFRFDGRTMRRVEHAAAPLERGIQ
jgi:hypothetical protein